MWLERMRRLTKEVGMEGFYFLSDVGMRLKIRKNSKEKKIS